MTQPSEASLAKARAIREQLFDHVGYRIYQYVKEERIEAVIAAALDEKPVSSQIITETVIIRPSKEEVKKASSDWCGTLVSQDFNYTNGDRDSYQAFMAGANWALAYRDEQAEMWKRRADINGGRAVDTWDKLAIAVEALKGIAGVHGETTEHGWKMRVDQRQAREALAKIEDGK
jgi:hypothetical protein